MKYCEVLHQNLHLQGFTGDSEHLYWSFTDSLVKTNLLGTVKVQIQNHSGHLGDIDYYDGKIYAALNGTPMGSCKAFEIKVYDASDLSLVEVLSLDECFEMCEKSIDGFRGINGVAIKPKSATEDAKMMVAGSILDGKEYKNQILLEYTLDGKFVKKHLLNTGNCIMGMQTIDIDPDTGNYWFSTYGGRNFPEFQNQNYLFEANPDFTEVLNEYKFCTPYGFHCLGGGRFLASYIAGKNGYREGYAYEVDKEFIESTVITGKDFNSIIKPWFNDTFGL